MDLSSQSNNNENNNDVEMGTGVIRNDLINNNLVLNNNIKSLLSRINRLRATLQPAQQHQNQIQLQQQQNQQQKSSMSNKNLITRSTSSPALTTNYISYQQNCPPLSQVRNSTMNNNNNNNNNNNITMMMHCSGGDQQAIIPLAPPSPPLMNGTTTSFSSSSSSSASSLASSRALPSIPFSISGRVPYMLTDDDRLPSNARILADRYLILNQITGSSFYECLDIRTGDVLTCKPIGDSYSKILSAYFRMDGDPHIKPLHKLLQSSNQTYLLLPLSQFGDLHSFVREQKRLRESEARRLFRQICKTVKSCHEQGIVLRDLKLRKFVFSDYERTQIRFESLEDAVVLDDPDDDILTEKIGCPAYVAPEILKPNSDFSGKAADLWSLGVILYTMLVGRYPFNDPEHSSLFAKIARCQFTIPDYVSLKARCLIKSLLQKVPNNRLTSEDVLYHPWLQEDNITLNSTNSNTFICNNNINTNDIPNDDQRVPDLDCLDFM